MRLPGQSDGEDVRLQEAREEANQEEERRSDGPHRETDPSEDQL